MRSQRSSSWHVLRTDARALTIGATKRLQRWHHASAEHGPVRARARSWYVARALARRGHDAHDRRLGQARGLPAFAVHDLVERTAVWLRDRRERPHRVAERQQQDALAFLGVSEHRAGLGLVADRGVAAPDAEVRGGQHHAHRRLTEIEGEGFAVLGVARCGRQQGDRGGRAGDVCAPLPQGSHPFQRGAFGHRDEVPRLLVHRGRRTPPRLDDLLEVRRCDRTIDVGACVSPRADRIPGFHGASLGSRSAACRRRISLPLNRGDIIVEGTAPQAASAAERRWPMAAAVLVAVVLQATAPENGRLIPWWIVPAVELCLLAAAMIRDPGRIDRRGRGSRRATIALAGVMTIATLAGVIVLIVDILDTHLVVTANSILGRGAALWVTNVIAFSFWYWIFDRGGSAERAAASGIAPSFAFPENATPELVGEGWRPLYHDYLYLAFTNATAFSPTDTLPLKAWAKMTMMAQSVISFVAAILVIARAIGALP